MKTYNCDMTFVVDGQIVKNSISNVTTLGYYDGTKNTSTTIEEFISKGSHVQFIRFVKSENQRMDIISMTKLVSIEFY